MLFYYIIKLILKNKIFPFKIFRLVFLQYSNEIGGFII